MSYNDNSEDIVTMRQFAKTYDLFLSAIVAVMILNITLVSTKAQYGEYGRFF